MSSLLWPQYFASSDTDDSDPGSSRPASPTESSGSPSDSCYSLKPYIPDRSVKDPVRAFLVKLVSEASDGNSQVFRADLRAVTKAGLTDDRRGVVCKVAYGECQVEILQKEADLYNTKLLDLQGKVVPVMRGCYVDVTDDGPTGVLILQYCGVPLTYELKNYALTVRHQAVNALLAIHKAGVEHNDFAERHIVVSRSPEGAPHVRIVDFGMAREHTCSVKRDAITAYAIAPPLEEFLCDELRSVCRNHADIWLPRCAKLFGSLIPIEHADSVESLLEHARYVPDWADPNRARQVAQNAINDLAKRRRRREALDANPILIEWSDAEDDLA
ncbi:hypothetical protein L226DRAFT_616047 [Lentinus tigrinus ALCF2SS1-7]|uniref:Protein kinase domain-containing protein n=1 Tax=Lentinus tigrinus ALCF2SS1-6 TaxID=1328759 RepID=A0A5C2RUN5_9APHY|nr:hypothetical protein L227DRAFT_579621 [Lentinus tigrinus ALCF2SS1-6]RPD70718.1 hypothetical protein L226DRAFT_616047 [Lentinus tigrinus ALCF2SS1-7]